MNYLLVGNGPTTNLGAVANKADVIVQINDCKYAAELPTFRKQYIFLTNTGPHVSSLVEKLLSRREHIPFARVFLARNPLLYTVRKCLSAADLRGDYRVSQAWKQLLGVWRTEAVSCWSTFRLERQLETLGMPANLMPSTGMIAYDWISRRLRCGDSLEVMGFTFEGWNRHPWEIERQLIKPKRLRYSWEDCEELKTA